MKGQRPNQGHVGVIQAPLPKGVTIFQFVAKYAPRAQYNGNVIIVDTREIHVGRQPCVRFSVTHVNANGTDASDLQDFAEEAAKRCGYMLPADLMTLLFVKPIKKAARPHKGSPRGASHRRRVNSIGQSASIGAGA